MIRENVPLSEYSTFGIGGAAKFLLEVSSIDQMIDQIKSCSMKQVPYIVIGKGSNTLFDSRGFDGLVIVNRIDFVERDGDRFKVGGGCSFSLLGVRTARDGWSGLEFASGIPASVGGAVWMNAGASGRETCDALESVDFVDGEGILHHFPAGQLKFSYRTSSFQSMKGAIVSATFKLAQLPGARERQVAIVNYRTETQPYGEKSIGCIFRNPSGSSAGALIEKAGLKGVRIGGAAVSEKHSNFIVNRGSATSDDVEQLIDYVINRVKERFGVILQTEARKVLYQASEEVNV